MPVSTLKKNYARVSYPIWRDGNDLKGLFYFANILDSSEMAFRCEVEWSNGAIDADDAQSAPAESSA